MPYIRSAGIRGFVKSQVLDGTKTQTLYITLGCLFTCRNKVCEHIFTCVNGINIRLKNIITYLLCILFHVHVNVCQSLKRALMLRMWKWGFCKWRLTETRTLNCGHLYSSKSKVTAASWTARVWFPAGIRIFSLLRLCVIRGGHSAPYQTTHPFGIKRPKHEADHSHPLSIYVYNEWSGTSTSRIRLHGS